MLWNNILIPLLVVVEPVLLAVMLFAFWFASPQRDQWLWLLALIPAVWGLRALVYRRLWTRTPLDGWLIALALLGLLNQYVAPYHRSPDVVYSYFVLMGRPLLGIALYVYFVEYARVRGRLDGLLKATLVLGTIITILALGASQWNNKSYVLRFFTDAMPRIHELLRPIDAQGGFNANEMGGALSWVCPLFAGLIAYYAARGQRFLRAFTAIVFGLQFLALFLGQSRFALAGVFIALAILIWLLIRERRGRWLAGAALAGFIVLEILIVRNVFVPAEELALTERDEASMVGRFDIWNSAISIIRDYPLTGVGLNMFRIGAVRERYPAPGYVAPILPHAHQEWLQVGTDMGLPGLIVLVGMQVTVAYMLYRSYRQGDPAAQAVTAGIGAGLLAHGFFGLGDAVTLWDRFAFVGWWLVALAGAQAYLSRNKIQL